MKRMIKKYVSILLTFCLLISSISILGSVSVLAIGPIVERLKTESLKNPLGIDEENPSFSWQMKDEKTRGQYQTAYQVVVSDGSEVAVWDSGKVYSQESYNIKYAGKKLSPSTRYSWNVTVWDKSGNPYTSTEDAWFETGLMGNNDFIDAQWISTENEVSTFDFTFDAEVRLKNNDTANVLFGRNNTGLAQTLQWNAHPEGNNFFYWKIGRKNNVVTLYLQRRDSSTGGEVDLASSVNLTANGYLDINSVDSNGFDLKVESKDGYLNTYIDTQLVSRILCPDARIDGFTVNQWAGCAAEYKNIKLTDGSGCVTYSGDLTKDTSFEGTVTTDGWKRLEKGYYLPGGSSFTAEATLRFDSSLSTPVRTAEMLIGAKDVSNYFIWQVKSSGNNLLITPHYYRNAVIRATTKSPYFTVDMGEDIAANKTPVNIKIVTANGTATTYVNDKVVGTFYLGHIAVGSVGFRSFSKSCNVEFKDVKYTINGVTKTTNELFAAEELGSANADGYYKINGAYNVYTTLVGNNEKTPGGAAPMLRKEFNIDNSKNIESARLYATATGVYETYINGERVGDSYLNPGRTRYTDRIMYQTYDVTDLVKSGNNAIGVILGRGWWRGGNTAYEGALTFTGKLLVKYTDGTETVIETNKDWSSFTDGHIRVNEIFNGEKIDYRKIPGDWSNAGYNEEEYDWSTAKTIDATSLKLTNVVAQDGPLTKVYKVLEPVSVNDVTTWSGANVKVYDFGQNIAGIVRITVKGNSGDTITLRHAELVNGPNADGKPSVDRTDADGALWERGNRGAAQQDTYILSGESSGETFEASFVYHGFRYMQLSGNDKQTSLPQNLEIIKVEALVLSSELEETGTFESSNEYINKYELNSRWSMIDNYLSIPTDCPQRDERYGWLSDAQVFTRSASYLMDVNSFMSKFVTDCNDDFDSKTNLYPGATLQFNPTDAIGGWTDGAIVIPYRLYQQYGNKNAIIENYDNMKAYIDQTILDATRTDYTPVVGDTNKYGDIPGPTPAYIDKPATDGSDNMYGDWFAYGEHTPYVITETAYIAYSTFLFSEMAKLIGNTADAEYYATEYEKFRTAWNKEFVNSDGSMKCNPSVYGTGTFGTGRKGSSESSVNTQGAYIVGLALGMFSDDVREKAVQKLVERIETDNYAIKTGFLGVSHILPILTETGHADVAYKMMEKTDFSSILWSVVNGATTSYERWDAYTETDTTYKYTDHSLNHYSYGSVTEWLYRYVLGIDTVTDVENDVSAFKNIVLQPTVGGTLTYANGSYNSIYGTIKSSWEIKDGNPEYTFVVPANTTATLYLPKLEKSKTYYEGTVFASDSEGVTSVTSDKDGKVAYELASGTYTFTIGNSNETDYSVLAGKKIICIGSSTTAGDYGSNPSGTINLQPRSYPFFLAQKTGAITKNMGNSGWSAKMTWENNVNGKRYLDTIDWTDADVVLIMLGNNSGLDGDFETDIAGEDYTKYNHDTQLGCYASIIKYAQEKTNNNARIILMTHPIAPAKNEAVVSNIASITRRVAERFNLPVIDNYTSCGITFENYEQYMPIDGQHCNEAGYELMADYIANKLLEYCSDFEVEDVGIPEVYTIDGKNTVFVSNLDNGKYAKVTYKGVNYYAYSTMNNAIAALGNDGGVIKVCGNFVEEPDYSTGTMAFIDSSTRNHILIEGLDSSAVWEFKNAVKIIGDVTFSNIKLRQTTQSGGVVMSLIGKGEFKEDCIIDTSKGWIFLSGGTNTILNGNKFNVVDFIGVANRVGTSASKTLNTDVVLNYSDPDDYPNLNCGGTGSAKYYYGNLNIYVNGTGIGQRPTDAKPNGRVITQNNLSGKQGIFSLIFNNGSSRTKDPDDTTDSNTSHYNYAINSYIDYIVRSDVGGTVTIKENANVSAGKAPTFKLVPNSADLIPCVGGTAVEQVDGEYLYTPELSNVQTTISVSWMKNTEISKLYKLSYKNISEPYGYMGRWYDRTIDGVNCKATISAGSELYFRVENTENVILSLKSQADQPPTLAVSVDGKAPVRVYTSKVGNIVVAQGLDKTKSHTIRVIVDGFYEYQKDKWTTGNGFAFEKAIVDNGGSISGIYPENKVILYFGGSSTEGVHAIYKGSNPYGNSYIGTYAFTNSSLLGMASYVAAYGGTGICVSGSGGVGKCIDVINNISGSDSSLPPYPDYDDVAAIVINHGANDLNKSIPADQFKAGFCDVIDRLAEMYPDKPIIISGCFYGKNNDNMEQVAIQKASEGLNVRYIHVGGTEGNLNYESLDWCHPTSKGGKTLGTLLAAEMRDIVGTLPEAWDGTVATSLNGAGTAESPYLIGTPAELKYFANEISANRRLTAHFKLTSDIVLNDISNFSSWGDTTVAESLNKWDSIGYYNTWNDCRIFQGTFDGNGHTIYGMYINENTTNRGTGLFGGVGYGATIKNLTLSNAYVNGFDRVGGISGASIGDVNMINTHFDGIINTADANHSDTNVWGTARFVGGLIGLVDGTNTVNINSCSTNGKLMMQYISGGFIGTVQNYATININNSYSAMDIGYNNYVLVRVGGFIGRLNSASAIVNIRKSHFAGSLKGRDASENAGAIVGQQNSATINATDVYYNSDLIAVKNSSAIPSGVTALTSTQFTDGTACKYLNNAEVDYNTDLLNWTQGGSYPVFSKIVLGDCNGDGLFDIRDLVRLKKYLANNEIDILILNANLNDDSQINSMDLVELIKYLLNRF